MLSSSLDITTSLKALALSAAVYVTGLIIYRLVFHPLAKYPGPFFAKISDLDNFYHAFRGDRHTNFHQCHEKYGPVYRYGPNRLSFNTATALHDIYGFKSNVQKSTYYKGFQRGTNVSTFNVIDKVRHAQKRRAITPAFSDRAMKGMEEYVLEPIRTWCDVFQQTGGKEALNMTDWCTYLSFDIMGALTFGRSFNLITSSENRYVPRVMVDGNTHANISGNALWAHAAGIMNLLLPQGGAALDAFRAYGQEQVKDRTALGAEGTDRKDFFHYLMSAKDRETGESFTHADLWSEANLLIGAGSDTTSTALSGTFYYLARNPGVLATVAREIRDVFRGSGVESIVSGPKLNSCVYLKACLEESLRMSPPLAGGIPREVCKGGAVVDGEMIPEGVDVSVGVWAIHHNKEYFPSPYTYNPSRWIASDSVPESAGYEGLPQKEVERAQSAFCAFSLGPRSCIGRNMAYMEMMLAIARVLFLFDLELAGTLGEGGPEGERHIVDQLLSLTEGPMIRFVERKI